MIRFTLAFILLVSMVSVVSAQQPLRTWTWQNGKQTLKARLIRVENGKAVIKGSGKQMGIPIRQLSDQDQELVKQFIEQQAQGAADQPAKKPKTISLDDLPENEKELFKFIRATLDWQRVAIDRRSLIQTVKSLQHRDIAVRKKALVALALVRPDPTVAQDVINAAKQARSSVDADFYKNTFATINTSWGNALRVAPILKRARNVNDLERMLGSNKLSERNTAMCALQWINTPESAGVLVKRYEALKGAPRNFLKNMGPVAAPAVAEMLNAVDPKTRRDACSILEDIGTSTQLGALKQMQLDTDGLVRMKATQAEKKIKDTGR